jgi:hypothetical protein
MNMYTYILICIYTFIIGGTYHSRVLLHSENPLNSKLITAWNMKVNRFVSIRIHSYTTYVYTYMSYYITSIYMGGTYYGCILLPSEYLFKPTKILLIFKDMYNKSIGLSVYIN